ncbi:PH domain-containing protein [Weissella soli]|uniref:PH domain-containing protein n=1 Tax=Weissella soli TaxID=155866 RepID=UPI001F1B0F99|nr:PH domain-containing protein [Weissella soli]GJM48067.1 hypothetical protein WSSLDB02_06240 [Weissella soli]
MLELDGEMYPVRVRWLWLLHRAVITVGLMIGAGIWAFCAKSFFKLPALWVFGPMVVVIFIGILMALVVVYEYQFRRYQITTDFVSLQEGLFFRTDRTIPINRIQNVDLSQGPFGRWLDLQSVNIFTAGSGASIDSVTSKKAEQLRDLLIAAARKAREDNER